MLLPALSSNIRAAASAADVDMSRTPSRTEQNKRENMANPETTKSTRWVVGSIPTVPRLVM
jgi:hypothetical protein